MTKHIKRLKNINAASRERIETNRFKSFTSPPPQTKTKEKIPEGKRPITDEMFIPNLSGDLSRGKILTQPTTDQQPANKKYVDDNSGTTLTIKEGGTQLGQSDIATLDFDGADFNLTETPDTEVNITIPDASSAVLGLASFNTANFSVTTGDVTIKDKGVAIAELADGTDGELITWSATGVATTVAVGTANDILTSNGIGVAPTFQAPTTSGHLTHIETIETVSNQTTVTFSSLNLDTDEVYIIFVEAGNDSGSDTDLTLNFNGDTTATNYFHQFHFTATTTITANSANNDNICVNWDNGQDMSGMIKITQVQPVDKTHVQIGWSIGTGIEIDRLLWNTTNNVTSIALTTNAANAIKSGSIFRLFRVRE